MYEQKVEIKRFVLLHNDMDILLTSSLWNVLTRDTFAYIFIETTVVLKQYLL